MSREQPRRVPSVTGQRRGVFPVQNQGMDVLLGALVVAVIAMVQLWVAIAVGFALHLHPAIIAASTAAGCATLSALCIGVGDRARAWILSRTGWGRSVAWEELRERRIYGVWQRYGVVGFAFVGPAIIGAAFAAFMGLALGVPARRLLIWLTIGNCAWCSVLTLLLAQGIFVLGAL
jgi:hypothetical protein